MKKRMKVIRPCSISALLPILCFLCITVFANLAQCEDIPELLSEKQTIGWLEVIRLFPGNLPLRAKMDSGAKYSSLNANRIEKFMRDGTQWVRFSVTNKKGATVHFEEKVIRLSRIKEHTGVLQVRPVIRLWFCIGKSMHPAEVNLVDRSVFNYQLLIGRNFLKSRYMIDPEKTFTVKSSCRPKEIGKK